MWTFFGMGRKPTEIACPGRPITASRFQTHKDSRIKMASIGAAQPIWLFQLDHPSPAMRSGDRLIDAMNVDSNGNGCEWIAPRQLPLSLFLSLFIRPFEDVSVP
jgi:hypothetical protein